ncbi:MAG: hypothetical protein E6Q53_02115 [Candidatus Moraniibacteriota bacterium]|nr:MAG: hypothetical protein E6Q53_02115 [Candidatus Moranbacteria bacterium]
MKFLVFTLSFVGGACFFPWFAEAREAGLTVAPVFQEVSFEAEEESVEFFITLSNDTDGPLVLRPSVVDFGSLDESGGVAFLGATDNLVRKYALASWMRPEKDVISLASGESEQLRVVIENRESLSPGGHYGAVLFQVGNEENTVDANAVAVNQLLSVLVFAKKQGGEVYGLKLLDYTLEKSWVRGISQARLRFQNEGNVHAVPRGTVVLRDPVGRIVQKGIINTESGLVLPETQRTFVTKFVSVALLLVPGSYTLALEYRYDGKESVDQVQGTLFLVPWPSIALVLVSILLLIGWWRKKK